MAYDLRAPLPNASHRRSSTTSCKGTSRISLSLPQTVCVSIQKKPLKRVSPMNQVRNRQDSLTRQVFVIEIVSLATITTCFSGQIAHCYSSRKLETARMGFEKFESKMKDAGCSQAAIDAFRVNYEQLVGGATGMVSCCKHAMWYLLDCSCPIYISPRKNGSRRRIGYLQRCNTSACFVREICGLSL